MTRFIWRGSTETEANSGVVHGRSMVKVLTIVNKDYKIVTINLIVRTTNEGDLYIAPMNMKLQAGTAYREWNINLEDRDEIVIQSNGRVDYYLSFGNPELGDVTR